MSGRLLTGKQVAEKLSMTERWLEKQRQEGRGIPYCKIGRSVRYRECEVEKFIEKNQRLKIEIVRLVPSERKPS